MTVTHHASGGFAVKMLPQADADEPGAAVPIARFVLDKRYHGALDAVGAGQMLSAMTPVAGSAGYVAIERVTGTLEGRSGSFVLQHRGEMNRGERSLAITGVPDSGSGELAGIGGRLAIRIEAGQHFYDFDYTLPAHG